MQANNVAVALISWAVLSGLLALVLEGKELAGAPVAHTNASLTVSKWWKGRAPEDPRARGCRGRPWICNQGERPPFRMRCCWGRCVDISSDVNHCGLCTMRCPFTWLCCDGQCRNVNRNPRHCGKCFNRCPSRVRCFNGMCGYAGSREPCPPGSCRRAPPKPQPPCPPKKSCPPELPEGELLAEPLRRQLLPDQPHGEPFPE